MELLRRGEISVGIVVPPDFERRRVEGREAVQVLVDGSDTVVQSAADPAGADAASAARPGASSVGDGRGRSAWWRSTTRSGARRSTSCPGLIGVILTMTMVLFTGVAIVRERERGNMELLIATPVSRSELMIGKVLPYAAIGLVQTTRGAGAWAVAVRRADPRQRCSTSTWPRCC